MPILNVRFLYSPTLRWEKVRRFYRDLLAFPETGGWDLPGDRGALLTPSSAEIEIMEQDAADLGILPEGSGGWSLMIEVDDLNAELARLASAGVVIERGAIERAWAARDALIRDPAGSPILLFEQLSRADA
jgi:catechol 2,3-dioxygenase-like lactoylglutathione lyase family enzyme